MNKTPKLALTLGDVAGIGPEITVKALLDKNNEHIRKKANIFVVGDVPSIKKACEITGHDSSCVRKITDVSELNNDINTIEVLQVGDELHDIALGKLSSKAGNAAYQFVVAACALGKQGLIDGIVTAPLNKEAMHLGGHNWAGHTEVLAHEFGVKNYSMILSAGDFYLFHLTTHQSLKTAIESCTPARTLEVINLANALLNIIDIKEPKIGVCGINPHAGENGLFGDEEKQQLLPAIIKAQKNNIPVSGPYPADALIPQAVLGKWPIVIACYHDQGHAPFKSVFGDDGVNITAGLPIVRVSVDHGTAFDIAGKNIARESSLVLACDRAAELSKNWKEVWKSSKSINNR